MILSLKTFRLLVQGVGLKSHVIEHRFVLNHLKLKWLLICSILFLDLMRMMEFSGAIFLF